MAYGGTPMERPELERRIVGRALAEPEFRARLIRSPREAVAEELGFSLPERLEVEVVEESPEKLTIVLPVDLTGIGFDAVWAMTGRRPEPSAKPSREPIASESPTAPAGTARDSASTRPVP